MFRDLGRGRKTPFIVPALAAKCLGLDMLNAKRKADELRRGWGYRVLVSMSWHFYPPPPIPGYVC